MPSREAQKSVTRISVGGNALLDVEDEALGAVGPIALSILTDEFLCQRESAIFRFGGLFLVRFVLVNLDESGAARGGVIQGFCGGRRLRMGFGVIFVNIGFLVGTLR